MFCYSAASGIPAAPVMVIEAADHHSAGARCMNKITIGKVYAYMRYAYMVYPEKNQVAFIGFTVVFYPFTAFVLLPCSALYIGAVDLSI